METAVREAFLQTYRHAVVQDGLYPDANAAASAQPLLVFELQKVLYEMRCEMDNRPDRVGVLLSGIAALAGVATTT